MLEKGSPVTREERRWVLWFSIGLLLITSLPYLVAYQRAGVEWRFTGFLIGVDDGNSYIAKMLRGAEGDWLFRSPYSAMPQAGFLAFLPYLLLGKLTTPPAQHEQLVALFHLYRWAGGILLAFAVYRFSAQFFSQVSQRRLATALALAGGGLGWLAFVGLGGLWGSRVPLEFYSPESFGFLSLFSLPHLEVSRALLLFGLAAYLQPPTGRRGWLLPGLLWLLLGFFQPLTIVSGWAVIGFTFLVRAGAAWRAGQGWPELKSDLLRAIITGLISAPWVAYTFVAFQSDPYLSGWAAQNKIHSPPVTDYLLAYLPMLLIGIRGARYLWRVMPHKAALLIGWLIALPLLAYFPYPLQRRLPEGIWVALCIVGVAGFAEPGEKWKKPLLVLGGLAFLPALFISLGGMLSAWTPSMPVFVPASQVRAFTALRNAASQDDVVLASFAVSNRIPAWAAVRTITGHGPESVGASEIDPLVERFFAADTADAARQTLLKELHPRFLVVTAEDLSAGRWNPVTAPYLEQIYADPSGACSVYRVILEGMQ